MARYLDTLSQAGNKNGKAISGATLTFTETGTSTFLATFQDEDLTIQNKNPVVSDGQGRFPDIWLQAQKYRVVFKDEGGVVLDTHEDVTGPIVSGATTLTNIAELTALVKSSLLDGEVFQVDGYFTQGDGGGGDFFFDSTSAVTENLGTIFETDEGGTGRWFRIVSASITPEMFGAVGDGATDDTAAIVAWWVIGGDHAMNGSSTYLIDSNTRILGVSNSYLNGNGALIKYTVNANARGFGLGQEKSNIRVENLNFEGPDTTFLINGIEGQNCTNVWLDRIHVKTVGFFGFGNFENSDNATVLACDNWNVTNCIAEDCAEIGFEFFPKVLSKGLTFTNNRAINCGFRTAGLGTGFKVGQAYELGVIADNTAIDCEISFSFTNWESLLVTDNLAINSNSHAYAIGILTHALYTAGLGSLVLDSNMSWNEDAHVPRRLTDDDLFFSSTRTNNGPIKIRNHVALNPKLQSILLRPTVATPNISIEKSYFDCLGSVLIDDSNGDFPAGLVIRDVEFVDTDRTVASQAVKVQSPNLLFEDCTVNGFGQFSLQVLGDGTIVRNTKFKDCNVTAEVSASLIFAVSTAVENYEYTDNYADGANHVAWFQASGASPVITAYGNKSKQLTAVKNGTVTVTNGVENTQYGTARWFYGSAAPVSGKHERGDIVWDETPTGGSFIGFVCTTSGTPGTFKTFGVISA